jgi:hypothetical protein
MTTIRATLRVGTDGNVVVPVGAAEAGREVLVTVEPCTAQNTGAAAVTQEQWERVIRETEGAIDDAALVRPDLGYIDPPPNFDFDDKDDAGGGGRPSGQ